MEQHWLQLFDRAVEALLQKNEIQRRLFTPPFTKELARFTSHINLASFFGQCNGWLFPNYKDIDKNTRTRLQILTRLGVLSLMKAKVVEHQGRPGNTFSLLVDGSSPPKKVTVTSALRVLLWMCAEC